MESAVILGGGVAGLAAGWRLAKSGRWRVTVLEQAPEVGGMCRTFRHGDLALDHGPHKCFSTEPRVLAELRSLMGAEFIEHEKRNSIYLFGRYLDYPIRLTQLIASMGPSLLARVGIGFVAEQLRFFKRAGPEESYERYIVSRFGRPLYEMVFEPLADKVWGAPPTLSADLARLRLSSSGFVELLLRALRLKPNTALTDAARFYYPRRGFGRIPERMSEEIVAAAGTILTSVTLSEVVQEAGRITGVSFEQEGAAHRLPCDLLISTVPFDVLGGLLRRSDPGPHLTELLEAAARLQYRHLILLYVVVEADLLTRDHWIFFPERSIAFGRISEQKQFSREMIPEDTSVICCDMVDSEEGERWRSSDEALGARCVEDLKKVGLLKGQRVRETFARRARRFYPRYDLAYRETLDRLYGRMKGYANLISTGRIGFYNYNNSDHCVDMALCIEEGLSAGHSAPRIMETLEQRVRTYRIVD